MKIELKTLDEIDPYQLAYHANNPHIGEYLRNSFPYPYTLDHAMSFITFSLQHNAVDFGIVVNDICVGCIGITFHKDIYLKNCEIGYWLSPEYWGHGIMQKVLAMLSSFIFDNYTVTKICAEVFAENKASAHILENNGFEQEGYLKDHVFKDGQYHDIILYGLRKESYGNKKI